MTNLRHGSSLSIEKQSKSPRWRAHCAWVAMRQRCKVTNDREFDRYAARGISVCDRWQTFENFYADMGDPPAGMSLDRKDNDKGYSKANCKWATKVEQMRNRSNCRHFTFKGETKTMAEWARHIGIGHSALIARINRGWSIERALSERTNAPSPVRLPSSANAACAVLSMGA